MRDIRVAHTDTWELWIGGLTPTTRTFHRCSVDDSPQHLIIECPHCKSKVPPEIEALRTLVLGKTLR